MMMFFSCRKKKRKRICECRFVQIKSLNGCFKNPSTERKGKILPTHLTGEQISQHGLFSVSRALRFSMVMKKNLIASILVVGSQHKKNVFKYLKDGKLLWIVETRAMKSFQIDQRTTMKPHNSLKYNIFPVNENKEVVLAKESCK